MTKKLNIAVIYGGTNTEHEVSIVSARSIIQNLDRSRYNILPVKITKNNQWQAPAQYLQSNEQPQLTTGSSNLDTRPQDLIAHNKVDVVFPVVHGPFGEDGTLQGLLEMLRMPYVGSNVLGSAICMDKAIQKQLCQTNSIPIPQYIFFNRHDWQQYQHNLLNNIETSINYPCFVKPANQGSSVGVSKATNITSLTQAINQAFEFDLKVIVEQAVPHAREIECAVLGNDKPEASILGEIIPSNDFYDYDAKYVDGKSTEVIPAKIPDELSHQIRQTAIEVFKILNCSGLARVDFLVNGQTNQYYLNEVNTMPGFTTISMYPKLWQASGLTYTNLLDKLVELAIERHQHKSQLHLNFSPKTNWHET